jgi:hypothetical protein
MSSALERVPANYGTTYRRGTTMPCFITKSTLSVWRMSVEGSPGTAMMSASFPPLQSTRFGRNTQECRVHGRARLERIQRFHPHRDQIPELLCITPVRVQ